MFKGRTVGEQRLHAIIPLEYISSKIKFLDLLER